MAQIATAGEASHPLGVCEDACFFLVGPPRAGTTLLRLLLNSHPEICVPPETWFFPWLMRRAAVYGDFSSPSQIERFAQDAAETQVESARPLSEVFGVTAREIAETVAAAKVTGYAQAFSAVLGILARREGKRIWGEKTPFYSAFLLTLGRCYPNARFLSLVRDPRDVVLSIHETSWGREIYPSVEDAAMRWLYALDGVAAARAALGPDRLLELRYEDLVQDPEGWTARVCSFLGVPFDPAMLRFHETAAKHVPTGAQSWHQRLKEPVSTSRIGLFRRGLTPEQTGLVELLCGEEMRRWGYAPEGRAKTPGNLLRSFKWRVRRRRGKVGWVRLLTPRPA